MESKRELKEHERKSVDILQKLKALKAKLNSQSDPKFESQYNQNFLSENFDIETGLSIIDP